MNMPRRSPRHVASLRPLRFLSQLGGVLAFAGFLGTATGRADITYTVTTGAASGEGSLADAITKANSYSAGHSDPVTINFNRVGIVDLPTSGSGQLFINSNVTIDGGSRFGVIIDGHDNDRIFFVAGGTVKFKNLTLTNGFARGGDSASGGAGAGLGGAIFVANGTGIAGSNVRLATNVTMEKVDFQYNGAKGGSSDPNSTISVTTSRGGGGMGGKAGRDGGGGFGNEARGGDYSKDTGGPGAFIGGQGGGEGSNDAQGGGGGGKFGHGGFGGGDGGGLSGDSQRPMGGGGLGAGGAIFLMDGAKLTVVDGSFGQDYVEAGRTASPLPQDVGKALGSGMFLLNTVTLAASAGTPLTIGEDINASDTNTNDLHSSVLPGLIIGDGVHKGEVILTGHNEYSGATTINAATLTIGAGGDLSKSNGINLASGSAILDLTQSGNQTIQNLSGATASQVQFGANTLTVNSNRATTFSGTLQGSGGFVKDGTGTLTLDGVNANTGAIKVANGTLAVGAGGSLANSSGLTLKYGTTLDISASPNVQLQYVEGETATTIQLGGKRLTIATDRASTLAGQIYGTGSLAKKGSGTLTLYGNNSYTGGTILDEGTLVLGSSGAISSGTLTINGGTLRNGTSTFQLFNPLVLNNSVTVGRQLSFSGNVTLGSDVTLTTLNPEGATSYSTIFSGEISGDHGLTLVIGSAPSQTAEIVLAGKSTYTGATTLQSGTLRLAAVASLARSSGVNLSGSGAVLDLSAGGQTLQGLSGVTGSVVKLGGTILTVGGATDTTFAGQIQGTGGLTKEGTGKLTLTGPLIYTSDTTVNNGTLSLGADTHILFGTILNLAGSQATFDISAGNQTVWNLVGVQGSHLNLGTRTLTVGSDYSTDFSGTIQGTGSLVKQGSSTLNLFGDSTYSGGTTLNAGTLGLGSNSALGTGTVTITGGSIRAAGAAHTITNPLNLNGSFTLGRLTTLAGNAVLGADITITSANPDEYAGGLTASVLSGNISGPHSITFAQGDNAGGSIVVSGNNTYTGDTTITSAAEGGIPGLLTAIVQAGSPTAFGTGSLHFDSGVLATANANRLIHVGNDYYQGPGGVLLLKGDPSGFDQLKVDGTAYLAGGTLLLYVNDAAPGPGQTFKLVDAKNGIVGFFLAALSNLPSIQIDPQGAVTENGVSSFSVTLKQLPFAGLAQTPTARSVATSIDRFATTQTSGPELDLIQSLNNLSVDSGALTAALTQLTSLPFANFTSTTAFNNTSFVTQQFDGYLANHRGADGTFVSSQGGIDYSGLTLNDPRFDSNLQMVHSRLLAWNPAPSTGLRSDVMDPVLAGIDFNRPPVQPWNVFVAGNAILAQSNGANGFEDTHATTGSVQMGADYRITPHVLVGALFGFGHTSSTLDGLGSKATVDTYSPGVYASYSDNGWYANALATYGFSDYSQTRNVSFAGFGGTANSSPTGGQVVGNLDGGYDFHHGPWTFGPTLGLQYVHLNIDSYSETGLPGANLTVNSNQADSLRSRLGAEVRYVAQSNGITFTPHLSVSWQHEFMDSGRDITAGFNTAGAGSFTTSTTSPSRESALAEAGLDAQLDKTWTVFGGYTAQVGQSNYFGQSIQAGVKIGF